MFSEVEGRVAPSVGVVPSVEGHHAWLQEIERGQAVFGVAEDVADAAERIITLANTGALTEADLVEYRNWAENEVLSRLQAVVAAPQESESGEAGREGQDSPMALAGDVATAIGEVLPQLRETGLTERELYLLQGRVRRMVFSRACEIARVGEDARTAVLRGTL
ncbi:MAG: hypothetical protein UY92_C0011G0067 [Candidatus Magasanikbacteria bacterium GW2011_GWA2_56_11]|uniref:Uncharacterized protein n=1 Tax=Candidatus Magasanikbacteria bacterium GW2011_GWA2_56_11 TaxID=1619044 RepID=A0A0G1YFS4_9BACT|nr:MAG: hypothetical protein UY92_C0011G0067 [Candidatus Magasanikbacteria bacterium GW2011_GWA2_56_11]